MKLDQETVQSIIDAHSAQTKTSRCSCGGEWRETGANLMKVVKSRLNESTCKLDAEVGPEVLACSRCGLLKIKVEGGGE